MGGKPRKKPMNVIVKTTERSSVGDRHEDDHPDKLIRVEFECSRKEAVDLEYALQGLAKRYGDDNDLAANVEKLHAAFKESKNYGAERAVTQVAKDGLCPLCGKDLSPAIALLGEDVVDWHLHIHRREDFRSAVKQLFRFKLEAFPFTDEMLKDWGEEGKENHRELQDCPFFSERVLYTLLGKMDARTVLAYVNAVAKAAGLRSWEIE